MRTRVIQLGDDCVAETAAAFVGKLAQDAGLPTSKAYWLRLAVEEITINIVRHGYRGHGLVRLTSEISPDRVWVRIEDEAPRFDPQSHNPARQLETAPTEREAGGFGLLLALRKLDGFCYERSDGQNRNTLTMFRPRAGTDASEVDGVPDGNKQRADRR